MSVAGRIGLIIPELTDALDCELIRGIYDCAKVKKYDVLIFTSGFNATPEFINVSYAKGLENIYELVCHGDLDGIIYAASLFFNKDTRDRIFGFLKNIDVPCVVLGFENESFPYIFPPQREYIKLLTEHMIEKHECKKLYCLTGFEGNYESEERLKGFKEALEKHNIPFEEKNVFYGDFWKDKPKKLGEDIISGRVEMPDCVVCASDVMAIALCDELKAGGIRVPKDIAVTGYDGSLYAYSHEPEITTVYGRDYCFGRQAFRYIYERITGNSFGRDDDTGQQIRYGTSCGCLLTENIECKIKDTFIKHHIQNYFEKRIERKSIMTSNYIYYLNETSTIDELIERMEQFSRAINNWKWLDVCLCEDWKFDFDHPDNFRKQGFSEKMILALAKQSYYTEESGYKFSVEKLLPRLYKPHEPMIVVFTSLHCDRQIFGYMATAYDDTDNLLIDEQYINWSDALCNGLKSLQKNMYNCYLNEKLTAHSLHDPVTGMYNIKGFIKNITDFLGKRKAEKILLLMVSFLYKNNIYTQMDLISANALRLSAGENEIYARLCDNVYAIGIPIEKEREYKTVKDSRTAALRDKAEYICGGVPGLEVFEIICDEYVLDSLDLKISEDFLEEKAFNIRQKRADSENLGDYTEQLFKLRQEIYFSPQKDWSISEILRNIGISRSHFQRLYKEQFLVSCIEDIINARLEKSKRLLEDTDMRVQEIARQCGYSNESHFMRQFKERYGITALQYRKNHKK